MDEFQRIHTLLRPLAGPEGLGLEDDAAWLQPPTGHTLIATKDALVAGVHFLGTEDPALIARKTLRVNLSDLAAMGATPYGYLLATLLPRDLPDAWLARFAEGLAADQQTYGCKLFGGDSVSTPGPMAFSVTMLGLLEKGTQPLRRSGALPGDALCVSGILGQAALGLEDARAGRATPLAERYHLPQPRIALGQWLVGRAHAAMDISDGLLQDAGHMANASGVTLEIDASLLPLERQDEAALRAALGGGDDYELLFALPEATLAAIQTAPHMPVTRIGRVLAGKSEVRLLHAPVGIDVAGGWKHC